MLPGFFVFYVKFLPFGQNIYIHAGMILANARSVPILLA
jgi:hypothetical protein